MSLNVAYVKSHWTYFAAGFVGLIVLYYLSKSLSKGTAAAPSSSGSSLPGGSDAVQSLSAAASLQNAQLNAQVETASYTASTQQLGIAAQLQASLAQTAGEVAVTQGQTAAQVVLGLDQDKTIIGVQQLTSQQSIDQTAIQGQTVEDISANANRTQVQIAQIQAATAQAQIMQVGKQVSNIQNYSKHAASDYSALAPILAIETGQGYAAGSLAGANAAQKAATSTGATVAGVGAGVGSAAKGIGSLLSGLFG